MRLLKPSIKFHKWIAALLLLAAQASLPVDASTSEQLDLVIVDTGLLKDMNGPLFMKKTEESIVKRWGPAERFHGSHMSRIIQDQLIEDKAKPVAGVHLPWYDLSSYLRSLRTAIKLKPRVISLSIDGMEAWTPERMLLERACKSGILLLVAAGNDGRPYPGGYQLPCMISISSNQNGIVPNTANLGDAYVPVREGEIGTSFATARAAALALEYLQKNPGAKNEDVKKWFMSNYPKPEGNVLAFAGVDLGSEPAKRTQAQRKSRIQK